MKNNKSLHYFPEAFPTVPTDTLKVQPKGISYRKKCPGQLIICKITTKRLFRISIFVKLYYPNNLRVAQYVYIEKGKEK